MQKNNNSALGRLLASDPQRARDFCLDTGDMLIDYHRLPLDRGSLAALAALPEQAGLAAAFARLFDGQPVNTSEHRPALHMALRAPDPAEWPGLENAGKVAETRRRMLELAGAFHAGEQAGPDGRPVRDILHIGIGGSDLGPRLVADALDTGASACRVHWLSGLDHRRLDRLTATLDPSTTAVIVASKSDTTRENMLQVEAVAAWQGEAGRSLTWAVTARPDRAAASGIPPERILAFPESVGGRFSLWSPVGLAAAAAIGPAAFSGLLEGAAGCDRAVREAPDAGTPAVLLALLVHALRVELDWKSLGVVSYEPRLGLLADWLQQLFMESLGKSGGRAGAPLIHGGRGTDLQHSLFQALHQGPDSLPVLLVGCVDDAATGPWRDVQLANLLAQADVLADGRTDDDPARHLPGGRPSITLLLARLDPPALGALLAAFEHAVHVLGCLWGVNPWDQWGVEEGKRVAGRYERVLSDRAGDETDPRLDFIRRHRRDDA